MTAVLPADEALFDVWETVWIPLGDGVKLAARIWLPGFAAEKPVPAVLEILPYRRRDATAPRDESTYPTFASNGIAGVRVDMRGSGDSDGYFDDEYSERGLADAEAVIAWIAAQDWCSGAVGMMGISWGGFNALQVAARRPPALKAVISIASTVDRIADDIHFKGGCHISAQLYWSTTMLSYMARPPDAAIVGEAWRDIWLDRLSRLEPLIYRWLPHQTRDAFWKHGSICEDFPALQAKAWVIAGWADAYRNTPWLAVAGLGERARATTGPWIHKYPHFAYPHPRIDFLTEAVRWWRDWLGGEGEATAAWPPHTLFVSSDVRPAESRPRETGDWMALDDPSDRSHADFFLVAGGGLSTEPAEGGSADIHTPQDLGVKGGAHFSLNCGPDLPGDQSADDARSVCFETGPLAEDLVIAGIPALTAPMAVDAPLGMIVARLVDVHPDGLAHRVSLGVLNLCHRNGSESPAPMTPNVAETVRVALDVSGYRFKAGHRIRLALSTTYFPLVLPPPGDGTVTLALKDAVLRLPTPPLRAVDLAEPVDLDPLPSYPVLEPGGESRTIETDAETGRTVVRLVADGGLIEHPGNGMVWRERHEASWSILPDDPLSVEGEERVSFVRRREGIETTGLAVGRLTVTDRDWIVEGSLTAWENGSEVFSRSWGERIPRFLM